MLQQIKHILRFVRSTLKGMYSVLACGVAPELTRPDVPTRDALALDWHKLGRDVYQAVKSCDERYQKGKL